MYLGQTEKGIRGLRALGIVCDQFPKKLRCPFQIVVVAIVDPGRLPQRSGSIAALGVLTVECLVLLDGALVVLAAPGFLRPLETSLYLALAPIRDCDSQPEENDGQ